MKDRLPALDGLKGLLAIFIVMYHWWVMYCQRHASLIPGPDFFDIFWRQGKLAVEFFFILSGFLVARKHKEKIPNMKPGSFFLGKLKICIPFEFALLLGLTIEGYEFLVSGSVSPEMHFQGFGIKSLLASFSFTQSGWGLPGFPFSPPLWYVCVLLLCYAFYEVTTRFSGSNRHLYRIFCILWIVLGCHCIVHPPEFPLLAFANGRGYAGFFMGALLAESEDSFSRPKGNWGLLAMLVATLCMGWYGCHVGWKNILGGYRLFCILLLFPTILCSVLRHHWFQAVLQFRPMAFFGRISMALFATHMPLLLLVRTYMGQHDWVLHPKSPAFFIGVFVFLTLFAYGWMRLVEKWLTPLLLRLFRRTSESCHAND